MNHRPRDESAIVVLIICVVGTVVILVAWRLAQ